MVSAEQGDTIGTHWMGVFYHEGFGVAKNIDKAIEYLTKAAERGNGQSWFQLYLIHSGKQGQEDDRKDPVKAYRYLLNAIFRGVTYFDEATAFFSTHFDELAREFINMRGYTITLDEKITAEQKQEVLKIHEAFLIEMKNSFSDALRKDRLYNRPCGFLNDQQIWMVGVQMQYMLDNVLRFNHVDFIKAIKLDLGPILGDIGLWSCTYLLEQAKLEKNTDLKKKLAVCLELLEKYMESGLDILNQEKKYNFINKFEPIP